jgi:hypothetical protein
MQNHLDALVDTHDVCPLPAYRRVLGNNEAFIQPNDVYSALKDALVRVEFTLLHYTMQDAETFNAKLSKVVILKPGNPTATSPQKRVAQQSRTPRPSPSSLHSQSDQSLLYPESPTPGSNRPTVPLSLSSTDTTPHPTASVDPHQDGDRTIEDQDNASVTPSEEGLAVEAVSTVKGKGKAARRR